MIHTNRCKHCGKTKEEHASLADTGPFYCHAMRSREFYDSGLSALDAHKEELYAFVLEVSQTHPDGNPISLIKKAQSILNQIEKEK